MQRDKIIVAMLMSAEVAVYFAAISCKITSYIRETLHSNYLK